MNAAVSFFSPPKQASQRRINIHFIRSGGKKERFIRCSLHPGLYLLLSNLEPRRGFVRKAIFTCEEMIGFFLIVINFKGLGESFRHICLCDIINLQLWAKSCPRNQYGSHRLQLGGN